MTTLMTFETSGGEKGRCDAKCYNAKHPNCNCCCGGRNHGAGLKQAMENTSKYADEILNQPGFKKIKIIETSLEPYLQHTMFD